MTDDSLQDFITVGPILQSSSTKPFHMLSSRQLSVLFALICALVICSVAGDALTSFNSAVPSVELVNYSEDAEFERLMNVLVRKEIEVEKRLLKIMNDAYALVLALRKRLDHYKRILELLILELSLLEELEKIVPELQDQETEDGILNIVRTIIRPRVENDKAITEEVIAELEKLLKRAELDYAEAKVNYFQDRELRIKRINAADEAKLRQAIIESERLYAEAVVFQSKVDPVTGESIKQCPRCPNIAEYPCSSTSQPIAVIDSSNGCNACACEPKDAHISFARTSLKLTYNTPAPDGVPPLTQENGRPVDWVAPR
jgi:hypothetical protein